MSKLSYKTLFIIFFFLLIPVIVMLRFFLIKPNPAAAGWWNDMWQYRQAINISSHTTTESNVYIITTVNIGSTTKAQTDGGDFRFVTQTGSPLSYYISAGVGTTNITFHVQFSSFPSGAQTIYVYYGNSSVTNGFSTADFATEASNYTIGSLSTEEVGGGPIAYWKFDEGIGTTTRDSSGNSNTGTITGATWTSEDQCLSGKCLSFNGTDKLSVNNSGIFDNTGPVSISIWVKPTIIAGIISIINRSGFTGPDNGFSFEIQDGKPTLLINNGRSAGTIQKCNQLISNNTFSHLEWTRDISNNNKIFINGKECTYSSTINTSQVSVNTTLGIGSKLNKHNIALYMNYSNRTYNQLYDIGGWGGDDAEAYYYSSGGYNNLPYKKIIKTLGGAGGSFIDDNNNMVIEDNKSYVISAWMKASRSVTLNAYSLCINRGTDNAYRTGGGVSLTTNWQRISWVYSAGVGHSGLYASRHIIYDDTGLPLDIYWTGFTVENVTGTGKTNPNSDFTGLIDEVKIYPYARTAAQIKLDYNSRSSSSGSSANLGIKSSTSPDLNSSLVAHYKFDENKGTLIYDSTNNATGTVYNGATWMRTNFGIGLSLGGYGSNDYISLSNQPLNNATIWSISTKLKYINLAKNFEFFLGQNDLTTGKILLRHNGYISFRGTNGTYYDFPTTSAEINNLDSNILFISNGTTIKLYINGIYKSSVTPASSSISINTIGNAWTDTVWTSAFVINELKIYNTALTDDQIKQDYNHGAAAQFGATTQTIGNTTTSLDYCIAGDTSYCASPVAEWKMDERLGTTIGDNSGNNNTGTFGAGNSAPTWVAGKIGAGLNFDGNNDYVDINSSLNTLKSLSQGTVELWSNKNSSLRQALFFIGYDTTSYWSILHHDTGKIELTIWEGNTNILNVLTNNTFTGWNHIAISTNSTGNKIFVNGIQQAVTYNAGSSTTPNFFDDQASAISAKIGMRSLNTFENFFNGKIDQVRIYNYARTPAQIAYDYNKGKPVGWWKLDECQGNIAQDSSGIGNTGTIIIGASGTQNSLGTCQIGTSAAWTNGATGKTNSSLNFDGTDDYISITDIGTSSILDIKKEITVSAWVKPNFTSQNRRIVTKLSGTSARYAYSITARDDGKFRTWVGTDTNYYSAGGNTIYQTNQWYLVTMTYDGSNVRLYVNGKIDSSPTACTENLIQTDGNLQIGLNGGEYFNGQIDDIRIYNYALTAEQVKTIYNGGAVNFN